MVFDFIAGELGATRNGLVLLFLFQSVEAIAFADARELRHIPSLISFVAMFFFRSHEVFLPGLVPLPL